MSSLRLLLVAILTTFASAETITLLTGNRQQNSSQPAFSAKTITLEEGDIATALYVSNNALVDIKIGNTVVRVDANDPNQRNLPVVAGPATIRLSNFNSFNASLATFSIKRHDTLESTPSQVVVIPDDGSGERQVRLESSTDMVTWTPTQPGLFSSANTTRFFRVRMAKVPSE